MDIKWEEVKRGFKEGMAELNLTRAQKLVLLTWLILWLFSMIFTVCMVVHRIIYGNWGLDAYVTFLEKHGNLAILSSLIFTLFLGGLKLFLRELAKVKGRDQLRYEELFYRATTKLSIGLVLGIIITFFMQYSARFNWIWAHKEYVALWAQYQFVLGLILIAVLLYRFKKKAKPFFGLSEIVVAIASNLALLSKLDLLHLQQSPPTTQTMLAIGAFTYLLGRGIGNFAEGLQDIDKKRLERISKEGESASHDTSLPTLITVNSPDQP